MKLPRSGEMREEDSGPKMGKSWARVKGWPGRRSLGGMLKEGFGVFDCGWAMVEGVICGLLGWGLGVVERPRAPVNPPVLTVLHGD
jgi:hypothetical protein